MRERYTHRILSYEDINFIVIEKDLIADSTNSYFEQVPQPDGSILLKLVKRSLDKIEGPTSSSWLGQSTDNTSILLEGNDHNVNR